MNHHTFLSQPIQRFFWITILFCTTCPVFGQNEKLSFDADGLPITRTNLSIGSVTFKLKNGDEITAQAMRDEAQGKPVVGHFSVSGYYFDAVPEASAAKNKAYRDSRRRTTYGFGSMGIGFVGGAVLISTGSKFGDTSGPILFGTGFIGGIYFLAKRAFVANKDFRACIAVFNEHQQDYLPMVNSVPQDPLNQCIHLQKIYKLIQMTDNGFPVGDVYLKGEKIKTFNVGQNNELKKFNRKNLKGVLMSHPASAKLWKKATLHREMKLGGLAILAVGYAWLGGSDDSSGSSDSDSNDYLALAGFTASCTLLSTTKVSKILREGVRAYNRTRFYPDDYSQASTGPPIQFSGIGCRPFYYGAHSATLFSAYFSI